ncbi:MAG: ABC transporter ATP-binding protein [Thermoanaerobaculia bacterium]
MPPVLSVRDLTVELFLEGQWRSAVAGVSFDLEAGESLAIVGESGCGKTLLARALVNLAPEQARVSGSVAWQGRDLLGLPEDAWREIRGRQVALVFQEPGAALDPVRTIGDQIIEAIRLHRSVSRTDAREIARRLLMEVSLPDPEGSLAQYPHRLSGGQKQRAFLAMALAADPAVLIADEPTTALDATVSAQVLELLGRLRKGRGLALLLITHDLGSVARHSDRVLVLYAGRVVEQAPTPVLFREPSHPYTRGLLDCARRVGADEPRGDKRLRTIAGAIPDLAFRLEGACAFAPRCPQLFEPCEGREPSLYEVGAARARCFLYETGARGRKPPAESPQEP